MAGWYRQDLADDARIAMLLTLGQVDLVLAHLRITEHRVRHEHDDPPEDLAHWKPKLVELNLWRTLEELITVQLAQRARTNRSRKRDATSRHVTLHNVTTRDVTATQHNTTQQREESIAPPAESPAPAKPKRKPKAVPSFDSWMPKDEHHVIAKERKLSLAAEHISMRDWLASTGKTYKDYDAFARNWLRRARPEQQARPAWIRPGSPLLQKNPNDIPDDDLDYWTRSNNG